MMKKARTVLLIIALILATPSYNLQAGEPVTGLLICCRGSNMGPFLINGEWNQSHDYGDINQVRGILTNIKDAGINVVYIDMTNPSQWTRLWDEFKPMIENIRTVCAEKKMEYFIMIGAVMSDAVRAEPNMPEWLKTIGHLEFWNLQAKYIWENYAQDSHYRTYGYGDNRKIITMFYPGELVDTLWNGSPDEHKTYLSKFYRGTHEYNQDFKDTPTDGWGYRDKQQSSDGKIRCVCPTSGLHPGSSTFISQKQWIERVNWVAEAEHYSVYGSYDDTCDNIHWGIHDTKDVTNPNRKYANDDPYIYYNVVKEKLTKSMKR
jgi:hypothetical protein